MKKTATLLLINGPAGIGKSVIAKRYIDMHPLALIVNGDELVGAMGKWQDNEYDARQLSVELTKTMVDTHLSAGHDVVVPLLLMQPEEAVALEEIARTHGATFFECALTAPKEEAVDRMLRKGAWGEPGAPPLTKADTPIIEYLYDKYAETLAKRPNTVKVASTENAIAATFDDMMTALAARQATAA